MLDSLLFHLKQIAVAFDQLCNAFAGGWADETFSSRCYRWDKDGVRRWPRKLVDWVALHIFRDPDHCHQSFLSERDGTQLPPECRPKKGGRGGP